MKKTGDTYLDSEDFRALLSDYEMMVEAGQPIFMDADDLTDIAEYYNCIGEQKKSDDVIEYARSIDPDAASPLEFLAHKAINSGNLDEAQRLINIIDDESDPEYQYLKIEILLAQDKHDEACKLTDTYFCEMDDEDHNDFCYDIANLYANYEYFKTAKGWFDMIERETCDDYLELQSRIAYGLGNFDLCIDTVNKLIDKNPYSNRYWNVLSQAQMARGKVNEAITSSEYALAIDPNDVNSLYTKAMGLLNNDNMDEAIVCLKKAVELNPEAYDALMQLSNCYVEKDELLTALPYALDAINVAKGFDYESCDAYKTAILIYSSLKRPHEAMAMIKKAEQEGLGELLEPDVLRGYVYLTSDKVEEANKAFKRAFDKSKDISRTTMLIIMSLQDNGYYDVAYLLAKDFICSDDGSRDYDFAYAYMTFICMHVDKEEEAVKYLKIALKRAPQLVALLMRTILPEGLPVEKYYDYLKGVVKNKQQK